MKTLPIALLALAATLCACNDENRYSTSYTCNFWFRKDYHPTSRLSTALVDPGQFVIVSASQKNGITHLTIQPNDGSEAEDIALTTEIEKRYSYAAMGANQSLIIGCATMDSGTEAWRAYDRQCPYCLSVNTSRNFPLAFEGALSVKCSDCHRTYNLNTGASDDGQRLLEYRVSQTEELLRVYN